MPRSSLRDLCPTVIPIQGEPLRYWVGSRSRATVKHVVDLRSAGGLGECSCERWGFTVGPAIKAGSVAQNEIECRHVAAARRYLALEVAMKTIANSSKRGTGTS